MTTLATPRVHHPVWPTGAAVTAPSVSGGRAVRRREGPEKLTGRAMYTDDLVFPGAWYGVTVRSTEPHARLLSIERDPAFDWSRVVFVTAADIPGENVVALMSDDQPALVADEIRHVAEPVALVAAPDPETARAARDARPPADRTVAAGARPARFRSRVRALRDRARATSRPASRRPTSSSRGPTASATRSSCTSSPRR